MYHVIVNHPMSVFMPCCYGFFKSLITYLELWVNVKCELGNAVV